MFLPSISAIFGLLAATATATPIPVWNFTMAPVPISTNYSVPPIPFLNDSTAPIPMLRNSSLPVPFPMVNYTMAPYPLGSNDTSQGSYPTSNSTLAPYPLGSNDTSQGSYPTLNSTVAPDPTLNSTVAPCPPLNGSLPAADPLSSNTLILCNDLDLKGPCSYTALSSAGSDCTHVPRTNHSPDSTRYSYISSLQMPTGYICRFYRGSDGCVTRGSSRDLELLGPGYYDASRDWDNRITYYDCVPTSETAEDDDYCEACDD